MLVLLSVACVLLLCFWFYNTTRKRYKFPPGPKGLPILGNILELDYESYKRQVLHFGKIYSDAFTIKVLNERVVILNSYDMMREALVSPKYATLFAGRPKNFVHQYLGWKDEVLQTYSQEWVALRKLVFRGLKNYGTHLGDAEEVVQEELKQLVSRIGADAGTAVEPLKYLNGFVMSIILMLTTGQHKKYDDPAIGICDEVTGLLDAFFGPQTEVILSKFPWLRHLPFGYGKLYKDFDRSVNALFKIIFEGHKDLDNRKKCFLDYLMDEKEKGNLDMDSVKHVLVDILATGTLTTRAFLNPLILVLAQRPDIQEKIQEEIDREIGHSRLPCIEDKHRMPYTTATLWECFRMYATPMPLPRCTMEDVKIRDYHIPKDTMVLYNVWNVLHDDEVYPDSWKFNPDRFLDKTGDIVPPEHELKQKMVAFGIGKRQCIGEVLARLRIFLAMSTILQRFTVLPDPQSSLPDASPRFFSGFATLKAPPYKVVFKPRLEC